MEQGPERAEAALSVGSLAGRGPTTLRFEYGDRSDERTVSVVMENDDTPPVMLGAPAVFFETWQRYGEPSGGCFSSANVALPGASDDFGVAYATAYDLGGQLNLSPLPPDATLQGIAPSTTADILAPGTYCITVTCTDWAGNESAPVEACGDNVIDSICR